MTIQPSPYDLLRVLQAQHDANGQLLRMIAGMLDKSAPEQLLMEMSGSRAVVRVNRISEEAARPGETVEIDGKPVHTTKRRAKLLSMVMTEPMTLSAMARAGVSPTVAGVKKQIRDTNADLERAGVTRCVRMQALPPQRRGAKGGREPALYALLEPKPDTPSVLCPQPRAKGRPVHDRKKRHLTALPREGATPKCKVPNSSRQPVRGRGLQAPLIPRRRRMNPFKRSRRTPPPSLRRARRRLKPLPSLRRAMLRPRKASACSTCGRPRISRPG